MTTDDLLEAVDALTLPTHTRVVQWHEVDGKDVAQTTRIEHEPLLLQLEQAIASTIGAGGGRAMTAKWALNVLDSDALYSFSLINTTIRDWCRLAGLPRPEHPVQGLRAWYVSRLTIHDRDDQWVTEQLRAWAGTIRAKLNPSKSIELTFPCPDCGATHWVDNEDQTLPHPLRLQYQEQDPDILAKAHAQCRACGRVWRGSHELRALRWDSDQNEAVESRG
jgi:hypothetical protein